MAKAKDRFESLIQRVRSYTLDEQHLNYKRALAGDLKPSLVLYRNYEKKLFELSGIIELGEQYQSEL